MGRGRLDRMTLGTLPKYDASGQEGLNGDVCRAGDNPGGIRGDAG